MKKITAIASILIGLFACYRLYAAFFGAEYGEHVSIGKNKIYYTGNSTKTEAQQLGSFLQRNNFYDDGKQKDIQITSLDSNVFVRMVVDKAKVNAELESALPGLTTVISDSVFTKKPVNIQLCNDKMEPYKTVAYQMAEPEKETLNEIKVSGSSIFYNPAEVSASLTKNFGEYLAKTGFFQQQGIQVLFGHKPATGYQMSYAVKPDALTDSYTKAVFEYAGTLSEQLLDQAPVTINLCNENFDVLQKVSYNNASVK